MSDFKLNKKKTSTSFQTCNFFLKNDLCKLHSMKLLKNSRKENSKKSRKCCSPSNFWLVRVEFKLIKKNTSISLQTCNFILKNYLWRNLYSIKTVKELENVVIVLVTVDRYKFRCVTLQSLSNQKMLDYPGTNLL